MFVNPSDQCAAVEFRPDGLHLLARTTPAAAVEAAPAALTEPTSTTTTGSTIQTGPNGLPKRPNRIEVHLARACAGDSPVDICRASTIQPQSLFHTISGQYYYADKGGNVALWQKHYAQHKDQWDQIMAASWSLPDDLR